MHVRNTLALVAIVQAVPAPALPVLAIAVQVRPAERQALRAVLYRDQTAVLKKWRADGLITGYRLLFGRYSDATQWDAFEFLNFRDETELARWRKAAKEPFGRGVLALAQKIETTPGETVRAEGKRSRNPAVLVIPYQLMVPPPEYVAYLDGYTIPQFRGWMKAGILDGYDVVMSSYPAGRPWSALITLRYHDDIALGRRDEIVQATRAALSADRAWKALADSKKGIRSEGVLTVADEVSSGGDFP
ncbi:MAG TPA: hypothetical protein VJ846_05325 [Sphingomicrobium sp.]|nr:hypothetical protein [Sphingomicrobium sp.]